MQATYDAEQRRDEEQMQQERQRLLTRRIHATAALASDYHNKTEGEFLKYFIGDLVHDGVILVQELNTKRLIYCIRDCGTFLYSDAGNTRATLEVFGENDYRTQWFKLVEDDEKSEWVTCSGKEAIAYLEEK